MTNRPLGVTIVSIIAWLSGFFQIIGSIFQILGGLLITWQAILGWIALVVGIITLARGRGAVERQPHRADDRGDRLRPHDRDRHHLDLRRRHALGSDRRQHPAPDRARDALHQLGEPLLRVVNGLAGDVATSPSDATTGHRTHRYLTRGPDGAVWRRGDRAPGRLWENAWGSARPWAPSQRIIAAFLDTTQGVGAPCFVAVSLRINSRTGPCRRGGLSHMVRTDGKGHIAE